MDQHEGPADVFLSYARADRARAVRVADALRERGWKLWWDGTLTSGEPWSSRIEAEVKAARSVVVLWSEAALKSEWVRREARLGAEGNRLVPMLLDRGLEVPAEFARFQTEPLADWDGTAWHPEFRSLVRALAARLGDPPKAIPEHPPYPAYSSAVLGKGRPRSTTELALPRVVHPSPREWSDELLYLLIPDRFSDGREGERPLLEHDRPRVPGPEGAGGVPLDRWLESGTRRWQGGTLTGITSKLDYLHGLGVTALWLWPVFKQRVAADSYHGWAPQDFLEVDPHLGTRGDLVELVAQAHHRNMRVILSGEIHHSGRNWVYADEATGGTPAYTVGRHAFGAWLDAHERPVATPSEPDDAVWPIELRDPNCYLRAGTGRLAAGPDDANDPNAEFRRTDFFTLRRFDPVTSLHTLLECHRYWLALTDCDGFYLDLAHQLSAETLSTFAAGIREYAAALGKQDFLLLGELYGSDEYLQAQYGRIERTLRGNLSAIFDNGKMRLTLREVAMGRARASEWFGGYGESAGELGRHRDFGFRHVSILDDPDDVFGQRRRFAGDADPALVPVALAIQLFSLGIPCLYYGTEQALGRFRASEALQQARGSDVLVREAMFGPEHPRRAGRAGLEPGPAGTDSGLPGFGPEGTAGRHAFDRENPLYERIAGLCSTRRNHAALRGGRQYQRPIAVFGAFELPAAGELVAWSRILGDEEIVCVVNPNARGTRGGRVLVDASLNAHGTRLRVAFATGAAETAAAGAYRAGVLLDVVREAGTSYVVLSEVPPGAVIVLTNRWQLASNG